MQHTMFWGRTAIEVADDVRRGPCGVMGYIEWVKSCVEKLDLSPDLFHEQMEKLREALEMRYGQKIRTVDGSQRK